MKDCILYAYPMIQLFPVRVILVVKAWGILKVLTEKTYSHNLKAESLSGGNVQNSEPRRLHLSISEKTAPRRQKGESGCT